MIEKACTKCGLIGNITHKDQKFSNGTVHTAIRCGGCGAHLGFAPRNNAKEWVMPIGKYKGLTLEAIAKQDKGYLLWAKENMNSIGPRAKTLIDEILKPLNK